MFFQHEFRFPYDQADQFGRTLAYWAIFLLWAVFFNYRSTPSFFSFFFLRESYVIDLTKNGLASIWGDFFTTQLGTLLTKWLSYSTVEITHRCGCK
jgi:hypothetical protein